MSAVDIIDGRGYILNVEFGGGKDGVDGKDGRDGVAPDLQIGTVKESEDDQPHVTISDEGDGKLSLNFDLVSGQDGQNGEDGGVFIPSVSQEGVISWIAPDGQYVPPVNIKGETGATFTPEVSLGGEISWTNDKGLENPDTRSIKGPKGEKGDPFTIRETYASISDMNADFNNPDIPEGSFVCIASNESDPDNAKMYVKGDSAYVFVTDLSGATGMRGPAGIGIGKVEFTGVETATYKEYGVYDDTDDENLLGTFNLPKGADGHQGSDGVGIESIEQTVTSHEDDGVNEITVTLTDQTTSKFYVENGSKGSTGAQGPAGQNGQDGQDGVGIDDITVEQSTFDGQANVVTVHLSDKTTKTFNVYNGRTGATGSAGTLYTNNTSAATPTAEPMSNDIRLHKISKTGNYNDLIDKPTIPAAANDSRITIQRNGTEINYFTLDQSSPKTINILVPTTVAELTDESSYAKKSDLATVATSGSYYDLDDRPTIGNADLTIRSVDNATPETYTTIGTFHANAASPEYITLSKVARTGEYNDLIGKPTVSPVFDSMEMFSSIDRWPVNYILNMNRVAAISHNITDLDNTHEPLILLYYGKSNEQRIKYIPLPPSRTQLMEFTISATSLRRSTSSYSSQYYGSVTFWVVAETGADGGVIRAQIGRMRFNGTTSDDVAVIYQDGLVSPLIQNVNFVDYTVTPLPGSGITKDTIYDVENDNVEGDTDSVYVCIAKDEHNIKRLIVGLSSNDTDNTYGYSMNCSIRVMNTEAFKSSYEVSEVEQITPAPRS